MNKFLSFLLALVLLTSLAPTAFAVQTPDPNPVPDPLGTITVKNAEIGQTYAIYQILVLESYDIDTGAYSYKAADDWADFLSSDEVNGTYVNVSGEGYVTWVEGADSAAFAKLAREHAGTVGNQGSTKADSTTIIFDVSSLGYYLVDSTLGALCSLDTTNPDVTIKEKNEKPTLEKAVLEDETGAYSDKNDADIGQYVAFQTIIHARKGAEKYVLHDQMSPGLTLDASSVEVLDAEKDIDYTVSSESLDDGCTFEIAFFQDFLNKITEDKDITVSYRAALNSQAQIGGDGNLNKAKLDYGAGNETEWSATVTYTWEMDILKYSGSNETKVLQNAQFVLINNDKTKAAVFSGGKITGWADIPAENETAWPAGTILTTAEDGKIAIRGLDADTYYLREIQAPPGYKRLQNDVPVLISAKPHESTGMMLQIPVTAKVSNQPGAKLPTTGGRGTTIFYVVGTILLVGAGSLLVIKKKRK